MFFYNKYSNHNLLDDKDDKYKLAMADLLVHVEKCSEEVRRMVNGILFEGGFDDFSVNSGMTTPDNRNHEISRRLTLASLLILNPQIFEVILKNNAILFHGTNSNVLEKILQSGMYSEAELLRKGLSVLSGEHSFIARDFISFTDKLNLALGQSTFPPWDDAPENPSFSVVIGISVDDVRAPDKEFNTMRISSCTPEIGIQKHLPAKYIKFIAVPGIKVQEVCKLVEQYNMNHIEVISSDDIALSTKAAANYNPCEELICSLDELIITERKSTKKGSILK